MDASETPTLSSKRRWVRRLVRWTLASCFVLAAIWTVSYFLAILARDRAVKSLRERGKPTTVDELFSGSYGEAPRPPTRYEAVVAQNAKRGSVGRTLVSQTYSASNPLPQPTADDLRVLDSLADLLEELRQTVADPPQPLATGKFIGDSRMTFKTAHDSRDLINTLRYRSFANLARGRTEAAFDDVVLMFATADQLSEEPFLIPQLVRIAEYGVAHSGLVWALQHAAPTAGQFAKLDAILAKAYAEFSWKKIRAGERILAAAEVRSDVQFAEQYRQYRANYVANGKGGGSQSLRLFLKDRWFDVTASPLGLPVRLRVEAANFAVPDEVYDLLDRPAHWPAGAEELFKQWDRAISVMYVFGDEISSPLAVRYAAGVRFRRRLVLARLAIRLRRHFDLHGRFPDRLDALCDAAMPKIDLAWFDGVEPAYSFVGNRVRVQFPDALSGWTSFQSDNQRSGVSILLELEVHPAPAKTSVVP